MKILAASTDPEFATKIRMPSCTIDLAETGESVLQLFETNTYQGFVTDASLHDVDVWGIVRLLRSGKWCNADLPIIIVDDRSSEMPALLAANYLVKIVTMIDRIDLEKHFLDDSIIKPSILVIEDDTDAANAAFHALKKDYEIDLTESGKAGIEAFKAKRHDLVLLDLMLPDQLGIHVLKAIHKISPKQAIIISTARTELEMRKELILSGASEFLAKPYGLDTLRKTCRIVFTQVLLGHEIGIRESVLTLVANRLCLVKEFMDQENHEEAYLELQSLMATMPERMPTDEALFKSGVFG